MDMKEAIETLVRQKRKERNERYENRRYLVRVITECGLSAFINPEGQGVEPAKKNAYRYHELKNAVDTRNIASRLFKSAWIVIDYDGE